MLVGLVSDIHSNLEALEAVLAHMGPTDVLWCLGDLVGYGPNPNECVDLVRRRAGLAVHGNHDLAAVGLLSTADFNPEAAAAIQWTARQLGPKAAAYLSALPEKLVQGEITLAHGSPRYPVWEYVFSRAVARANFDHFQNRVCLVGHTHVPLVFIQDVRTGRVEEQYMEDGQVLDLSDTRWRFIANPGSVGQPRDRDPRASYAVIDTGAHTMTWHRVEYDVDAVQAKILRAGLPRWLAERLRWGT